MNRPHPATWLAIALTLGVGSAAPVRAQAGPFTAARSGNGTLDRGKGFETPLVEAAVRLAEGGRVEMELVSDRGERFLLSGTWSARGNEQRMLEIRDALGDPYAKAIGWVMTARGRLTQIEVTGVADGGRKMAVSFHADGADRPLPQAWSRVELAGRGWGELTRGRSATGVDALLVVLSGDESVRVEVGGENGTSFTGRVTGRDRGTVHFVIDEAYGSRGASGSGRLELRGRELAHIELEGRFRGAAFSLSFAVGARPPRIERPSRGDFTEEYGYDQRGGDLRSQRTADLEECQQLCAEEWQCRAYTFNTRDRICYLKDSERERQRRSDAVTGVKRAQLRGLSERVGYDLRGGDYTSVFLRTLEECQEACRNDRACLAYTYNTRSSMCFLKDGVGAYERRADRVSGEKPQRR